MAKVSTSDRKIGVLSIEDARPSQSSAAVRRKARVVVGGCEDHGGEVGGLASRQFTLRAQMHTNEA
ncbi:hypothetical protein KGM_206480 [Danaus plexippus plexippus]|uniref:Uncharacterized protein n=1 Tax=Danaus plexippus plexippus TaxID=278856 RepID=A0A212ERC7_DANPL|nr:hypothetical protein KGM_206480 [Danaus plexippus plexippus]